MSAKIKEVSQNISGNCAKQFDLSTETLIENVWN